MRLLSLRRATLGEDTDLRPPGLCRLCSVRDGPGTPSQDPGQPLPVCPCLPGWEALWLLCIPPDAGPGSCFLVLLSEQWAGRGWPCPAWRL